MKTYPNQKIITVKKENCDNNKIYAKINIEAMEKSAQDLKAGGFKLWMYFAKNQNGYEFALSSKDIAESFGMDRGQYNRAIEELTSKGYLVNIGGNRFEFMEKPLC